MRVYTATAFRPLAVLEYHRDSVFAVAYAPIAGSRCAAAGKDGRVTVWDLHF